MRFWRWLRRWPCRWPGCTLVATPKYIYCARCLTVWTLREGAHSG